MASAFQFTTSPSFEGIEIEAYLGVVASNVVTGTGLFSDIFAAFSDFFGGRSNAYKKQLDSIRDEAMREIESKARALGANAVVSLSIDNDQISGKNTQMLMISVTATAVKLKNDSLERPTHVTSQSPKALSSIEINHLLKVKELESRNVLLSLGSIFSEYQDLFTFTPTNQLARILVRRFLNLHYTPTKGDEETQRFLGYLGLFNYNDLCEIIYREARPVKVTERSMNMLGFLALELNIYNDELIHELLSENDNKVAVKALILARSQQSFYSYDDVAKLKTVKQKIEDRFPVVRQVYEKKKSLGRVSAYWECANGHESHEDHEHCFNCRLTRRDIPKHLYENALATIDERISTLEKVFNEQ